MDVNTRQLYCYQWDITGSRVLSVKSVYYANTVFLKDYNVSETMVEIYCILIIHSIIEFTIYKKSILTILV